MILRRAGLPGLLLLTVFLGWDAWVIFWSSDAPSGWDGGGHEGLITLVRNHADRPGHGVFKEWFAGMPFPHFLPPLFHWVAASLSAALDLTSFGAARLILTICILALPLQVYALSRRLVPGNRLGIMMGGVLAAFQVTDFVKGSSWGLGLHGVMYAGLLSYGALLPLWLGAVQILAGPLTPVRVLAGGLMLTATILGNPHVAIASAMSIIGCLVVRWNWRVALLGLTSVALSGFWWWPMLARHDFFPTRRLPPVEFNHVAEALPGLLIPALWGFLALPKGSRYWVGGLGTTMLVIMALPGGDYLPLQPHRLLAPFILILCIPAGAGLASLAQHVVPRFSTACAILLLMPYGVMHNAGDDLIEVIDTDVAGDVRQIVERFGVPAGRRFMIEPMDRNCGEHPLGRPGIHLESNLLESRLAGAGHEVLTCVFRESALVAMFSVPVRNALATARIHFGLDSHLVDDPVFLDQPPDRILLRAAELGATHWLAHSPQAIGALESARLARRTEILGRWHLFELTQPRPQAEVLATHPAWIVATWNAKHRQAADLDWLRMAELLFAHGGGCPMPVWPLTPCLDDLLPTPGPNALVLVDYGVRDPDHVQEQLRRHVEKGGGIVYDRSRPGSLASWLQQHRSERVVALDFGRGEPRTSSMLNVDSLAKTLDQLAVPVVRRPCVLTHPDHRSLAMNLPPGESVPVLVRYAWGPDWSVETKDPVFLAGPGFMLLYASRPAQLKFETAGLAWGCWISSAGLISLVFLAWLCPRTTQAPGALGPPHGVP